MWHSLMPLVLLGAVDREQKGHIHAYIRDEISVSRDTRKTVHAAEQDEMLKGTHATEGRGWCKECVLGTRLPHARKGNVVVAIPLTLSKATGQNISLGNAIFHLSALNGHYVLHCSNENDAGRTWAYTRMWRRNGKQCMYSMYSKGPPHAYNRYRGT